MNGCARWGTALVAVLGVGHAFGAPVQGVSIGESADRLGVIDLPSGMRVVIEEDRSKPMVAVVAVLNVGAAADPIGKEGLAHLVEHLTFRARPDGKVQRSNLLDFAGAASWNASTTHDLTTYTVVGPKEALRNVLVIEGGRLAGPLAGLDARAFEVERDVVKNEMTQRDERGNLSAAGPRLYAALYPEGHPYHRPVTGSVTTVSTLSLADAQAFVQQFYTPSNVTLYIAGDVDLSSIHQVLGATLPKSFIEAPPSGPVAPQVRLPRESPVVPGVVSQHTRETVHGPTQRSMIYLAWSLPLAYGADEALQRLIRSSVEAVPVWATQNSDIESIRATLDAGPHGSTLLCAVRLKEGRRAEDSLDRVLDQFHNIWEPGPPPSSPVSGQMEASSLSSSLDSQFGRGLLNQYGGGAYYIGGGTAPIEASRGPIGNYDAINGNAVFAPKVPLQLGRLQMIAVVGDALETESLAARAEDRATLVHYTGAVSAWGKDMVLMTDVGASKWQAFALKWMDRNRAAALFVEPSGISFSSADTGGTPAVFAADDVRVKIAAGAMKNYVHGPMEDIQVLTLQNGLQVLLARRLGAPTVAVTLGVRGGGATGEPLGAPQLAVALIPSKHDRSPPSEFGGRVVYRTSASATFVEGRAASGNLENLLELLSDAAQSPKVPNEFGWTLNTFVDDKRRSEALKNIEANRAFRAETYPGSTYGRTALAADFKKLGTGDAQRWADRSFRPSDAVLAVVGDIDLKEAEKQVRISFEAWTGNPDPKAEAPLGSLTERIGPVRLLAIDRPGAAETEIRVGCSVPSSSDTEVVALRLLAGRLTTKLGSLARTTLGGSDGFGGGASFDRQVGHLDIAGSVDQRTLIPVLGAARKELADLDYLKPTEDELSLLKWRQGTAWNGSYATNSELAQGLVRMRLANLPVEVIQKYSDLLAAVTADDLTKAAAACRKTAVLLVSGDPAVVDKALLATENILLRH